MLVPGALGITLLSACGPVIQEEVEPELMSREDAYTIGNNLSLLELLFNGILGNVEAREALRETALSVLFNTGTNATADALHIRNQLTEPSARKFMKYLVGCALGPDQSLPWASSASHVGTWQGEAGLCTSWLNGAPSDDCKKAVSACMLSRVNGVGSYVEISMRGRNAQGGPMNLAASPNPVDYSSETGNTVASLKTCLLTSSPPPASPSRNCSWQQDKIGSCMPLTTVWLRATTSGAWTFPMVRVCKDITSCSFDGPEHLQSAWGPSSAVLSFICPESGFFNVMKAATFAYQAPSSMSVGVYSSWNNSAKYPLTEKGAFPFREGAFYGDIFKGDLPPGFNLTVTPPSPGRTEGELNNLPVNPIVGSIYPDMYACHDPQWTAGAAYTLHRVCALPNASGGASNCAATVVGSCATLCTTDDAGPLWGDKDYGSCRNTQIVTPQTVYSSRPVTVFLNGPCDLMPESKPWLCERGMRASPPTPAPAPLGSPTNR